MDELLALIGRASTYEHSQAALLESIRDCSCDAACPNNDRAVESTASGFIDGPQRPNPVRIVPVQSPIFLHHRVTRANGLYVLTDLVKERDDCLLMGH